jgi:hypothetical protein
MLTILLNVRCFTSIMGTKPLKQHSLDLPVTFSHGFPQGWSVGIQNRGLI